ncbi:MAG: tetratricopeptide repeat protein [Acidobacteria bacterium]|nr:tetratricopeptide repeat protein [Acidobacteriota bacterium]
MTTTSRWIAATIVVVAVAAAAVFLLRPRPQWTTSSPEALREFQAGMNAEMKLYNREALAHFKKAVELDPGFVMARIRLAQMSPGVSGEEAIKRLRTLLASADLTRLTPRERFLILYLRARVDGKPDRAEGLLDAYLARYPEDPYALNLKAGIFWKTGQLAKARAAFERLVKVSPNWVVGYNSLGYIAMEQGDFSKSEENFATYKFIAPDQANPLDSLGELYLLTGRYHEAIEQFRGAIKIKHDFCASWDHLAAAYLLEGDMDSAHGLLERMDDEEPCSDGWSRSLRCTIELYPDAMARRWRDLLKRAEEGGCSARRGISYDILIHRAAIMAGEPDLSRRIEDHWRKLAGKAEGGEMTAIARVLLVHGAGVRAVAAGDLDGARKAFRRADGMLRLRGSGEGLFKLFNLACLAEVERAAGDRTAEKKTIQKIRKVNPSMASAYESGRFRPFGLQPEPGEPVR